MKTFYYSSGILNGGMNNKKDELSILPNQLVEAQNIIFDENNNPQKRPGVFSSTANGKQWKTGITENGKTKSTESIYTYIDASGLQYIMCFAGTTLKYSTNMVDWITLKSDFDTNYKLNFATYKDKLIITNGKDNVYTFDGSDFLEANGFKAQDGNTGNCSAGVHRIKITYEYGGIIYSYDTVIEHTSAGNKTINLSKMPIPPVYSEKKTIYMTKANETNNYYKVADLTNIAALEYVINVSDSSLTELYPSNAVSVKPPRCKFVDVFNNRLFLANSIDADSEVYWSEVDGLEFPANNTYGINVNDKTEITGIKLYKSLGKIFVFKPSGMWVGTQESDTFVFRNVSSIGCDFPYSIQEFNISDEYGERTALLWANKEGVWEWSGNNARKISDQANGSSIQKTWDTIRQRRTFLKKSTITTDAQFQSGDFNTGAINNWMEVVPGLNRMEIKNIFTWQNSYGIKPQKNATITAMCWDNVGKRIFSVEQSELTNYEHLSYFTWDNNNKYWIKTRITLSPIYHGQSGITTKIEYDATNDRLYGITEGGSIWRSTKGVTNFEKNSDAKSFNVIGNSGTIKKSETTSAILTPAATGVSSYIKVIGDDSLNVYTTTKKYVEIDSSTDINKAIYISHRTDVKNEGNATVYLKKVSYSGANQFRAVFALNGSFEGCNYDVLIGAGQTETLTPGYYCAFSYKYFTDGQLTMKLTYQRKGNVDMKIISSKLYFVDSLTETLGGSSYSKNNIKYIDISNDGWGTPINTDVISKSFVFMSKHGQYLYLSFSNATGKDGGFGSYIGVINTLNSPTTHNKIYSVFDSKHILEINSYYNTNHLSPIVICSAYTITNGVYEVGKIFESSNNTIGYSKISDKKIYNNSWYSLEILKNKDRNLWYFVDDATKKLTEINISGIDNILYDAEHDQTSYNSMIYSFSINEGVPDMIIPITDAYGHSSSSSAFWRGIVGNYTLNGTWLKTKIGSVTPIDTGENSIKLNSLFVDTSNVSSDGKVYLKLYTSVNSTDYINPRFSNNIMVPVVNGDTNIDGSSVITPGGSEITITLLGKSRYVHEFIGVNYTLNNVQNSVESSFVSPSINAIILNWTESSGGTIPETDVVSAVFNNRYYIAFVEQKPKQHLEKEEKRNNIIAVLDRFKRWSFWRGRPCYVGCFTIYSGRLIWADAYLSGNDETESDYIYVLGERGDINGFADHDVTSSPPSIIGIDAYIITKNFDVFADKDSPMFKKQLRHIYITSNTFDVSDENGNMGSYILEFGWRPDEKKYENDYNGHYRGEAYWFTKNINIGVNDLTGKKNIEINFPNYQPAKRHQFRFRNNTLGQDFGFIKFELTGKIYNARG